METDALRRTRELLERLKQDMDKSRRPETTSARTPYLSTNNNDADSIERQLWAEGHRIWGMVVYRSTYTDDAAWAKCIELIRSNVHEVMTFFNGMDLMEPEIFKLTVIEDAALLDGASTQTIRQHFDQWCSRALYEEQGSAEEMARRRQERQQRDGRRQLRDGSTAVRYQYCIQVDEESMRSIIASADNSKGWVKLIQRDWHVMAHPNGKQEVYYSWSRRPTQSPVEQDLDDWEVFPAIEGCTSEDVGWMKVDYGLLMPYYYAGLWTQDQGFWNASYIRPPDVARD